MEEFEFDIHENNEKSIKQSLRSLRQFISTNSTNKVLIIQNSSIASQLKLLCDKICNQEVQEYCFLEEFLGTLNSLALISTFKSQIIYVDFIKLLFEYTIKMEGNIRKNSILLLRTLLNAQNINTILKPEMELYDIIKVCVTPDVISHLLVIPCLSLTSDDYFSQNNLMEKRTGLFILQLLSVLSTDSELNRIMFLNQIDYLHVLHRLLMQLNIDGIEKHETLSFSCSKMEAKYILKIIAYFLFYNSSSIDHLLTVLQCKRYQDLIRCYEFLLWVDEKYTIALLGLVRALMFWRICLKLTQQDNSSIEAITNLGESIYSIGLGLTLEDIVKMIITPLTFNDSYLEFDGLGCWVMHALFLVLQQHFNLSELLMQCNGFLDTINKKLTPKIQCGLEKDDQYTSNTLSLEKLYPLLKLLAWMSSQSDAVKISVGESEFFIVVLENYQKSCTFEIPNNASVANFQKSIWLLIQALSRSIYLHRTLFHKVAKYSNFIKKFADSYIDGAMQLPTNHLYWSVIIDIINSCLSTVSNLILPTSPLRNDMLDWAMDKFINMTNGKLSKLTDTYPMLKLCGMSGLVNSTYSMICYDDFFLDGPGDSQDKHLYTITSHLIDVMPSALGTSLCGSFFIPDLHDRIVLMMWALFRNSLKSKSIITSTVNSYGCDILNFIVSTLESERTAVVKEQALIVLAHIATNTESREGLLANEDLMEKIKLFTHSPNCQLKTAAFYAAFNIIDHNTPYPYEDILREIKDKWVDYSVFWEFLRTIK